METKHEAEFKLSEYGLKDASQRGTLPLSINGEVYIRDIYMASSLT